MYFVYFMYLYIQIQKMTVYIYIYIYIYFRNTLPQYPIAKKPFVMPDATAQVMWHIAQKFRRPEPPQTALRSPLQRHCERFCEGIAKGSVKFKNYKNHQFAKTQKYQQQFKITNLQKCKFGKLHSICIAI